MKKKKKQPVRSKSRGLPITHVSDVATRDLVSKITDGPPHDPFKPKVQPTTFYEQYAAKIGLAAVGMTAEQTAMYEASEAAKLLMRKASFTNAITSMIEIRRLHAMAYQELQALIQKERDTWPEAVPFPLVEDYLIGLAAFQASKPFSAHTVMDNTVKTLLPWMATVVDSNIDADNKARQREQLDAQESRKSRSLSIGIAHTFNDSTAYHRSKSLVLVGWRNAILWILDTICNYTLKPDVVASEGTTTVVRISETATKVKDRHKDIVRVGGTASVGCADSDRKLAMFFGEHVADQLSSPPDLIICDDLPLACTEGFIGRPAGARAGDAHKRFRRWCDHANAGFIGGIGLDTLSAPDVSVPDYSQLHAFALLRIVTVIEAANDLATDCYRVILGRDAASVWDVPKAELDNRVASNLILPVAIVTT